MFTRLASCSTVLNFIPLNRLSGPGVWDDAGDVIVASAQRLEQAGAECLVLCSNTMNYVAGKDLKLQSKFPSYMSALRSGEAVRGSRADIGFLGTSFTLEHGFLDAQAAGTRALGRAANFIGQRQRSANALTESFMAKFAAAKSEPSRGRSCCRWRRTCDDKGLNWWS